MNKAEVIKELQDFEFEIGDEAYLCRVDSFISIVNVRVNLISISAEASYFCSAKDGVSDCYAVVRFKEETKDSRTGKLFKKDSTIFCQLNELKKEPVCC
jgi:hypothetical protein